MFFLFSSLFIHSQALSWIVFSWFDDHLYTLTSNSHLHPRPFLSNPDPRSNCLYDISTRIAHVFNIFKTELFTLLSPLHPGLSTPVPPDSVPGTIIYSVMLTWHWAVIFDLCLSLDLRQTPSGNHVDSTS